MKREREELASSVCFNVRRLHVIQSFIPWVIFIEIFNLFRNSSVVETYDVSVISHGSIDYFDPKA